MKSTNLPLVKSRRTAGLLIALVLPLGGCATQDPIAADLESYMSEMKPLGIREEEIIARQASVIGSNYKDDETSYEVLSKVVPDYTALVEDFEGVRPETAEVRDLHEVYLKAVNLQQAGMARTLSAIELGDFALVADANKDLSEGRALVRTWENDVKALARGHTSE